MVLQAPPPAIPVQGSLNSVPTTYLSTQGASQPTVIILTQSQPQVPPRPQPPSLTNRTSYSNQKKSLQRQLFLKAKMFCCCLCCPAFKCALITATLEIIFGVWFWWDALDHVVKTLDYLQLKDVVILLFLTAWLVAAGTAYGTLIAAHQKKTPHFVWPRLVLLGGLLITCAIFFLLLFFYFSGGSQSINNIVLNIIEFFMQQEIPPEERKDLHGELVHLAYGFTAGLFFFTVYTVFGWCATRKFYNDLLRDYRNFHPVAQGEPSAPSQPAYNPNYAKGV